jgi:ZIP family zinc transporter
MRLGLLMAITMTLHNLPEGFAVAFSSFTDIGPVMATAIGVHNIPEGIIVAAPVYAATGSRRQALLMVRPRGHCSPRHRVSLNT